MIDQNATARGLGVTVRPVNGSTGFTPTPPAPPIGCAYLLNAPISELQMINPAAVEPQTVLAGDQGFTHAFGAVGSEAAVMGPAGIVARTATPIEFGTDPVALELVFDGENTAAGGSPGALVLQTELTLITATGPVAFLVNVNWRFYADGSTELQLFGDPTTTSSITPVSGQENRLGVLLDPAGSLRLWVNGAEMPEGPVALPGAATAAVPLLSVFQGGGFPAEMVGVSQTVQLLTNGADFTSPFPAGSRDLCGTVFN